MRYNWQYTDWPNFVFDVSRYTVAERQFLKNAGELAGSMRHVSDTDQENLRVELMSDEALKTSEIEGELLNRDSLQSSVRRQFGLKTDNRRVSAAEQGISEMLVDVYQSYDQPLDHACLFDWHRKLTNGRIDLVEVGAYRKHLEPMQIVSGRLDNPKVHFEAPPSDIVETEMSQFLDWFNHSRQSLPGIVRAALAHLYFESIHPFEDGNGRIGRAISEKALSQTVGKASLISIATIIEQDRKEYYEQLQKSSRSLLVEAWLDYFCDVVLRAQRYTQNKIDFIINKSKFYQLFKDQLNDRQAKAMARIFLAGVDGFAGGMSATKYINLVKTSRATATRDLQGLVDMGALEKVGERKTTRYLLKKY